MVAKAAINFNLNTQKNLDRKEHFLLAISEIFLAVIVKELIY